MKDKQRIKQLANKLQSNLPIRKLDLRKFLNKKVTIYSDDRNEDEGIVREVYEDYIMIIDYDEEMYIPIQDIMMIKCREALKWKEN